MSGEQIKWHPAFAAALQLELSEYNEYLQYFTEYQLSDEPLKIDVLVIKKVKEIDIPQKIGSIFKKHNIFEYKSPKDYLSIDDYFKVKAYAYLYKALGEKSNTISLRDITISLTSTRYPRKLIEYLQQHEKLTIIKKCNGIYYVEGSDITTQVIVIKDLTDKENYYINMLQFHYENRENIKRFFIEYLNNNKNPLYAILLQVLAQANENELVEVYRKMGVTRLSEENKAFLISMAKQFKIDEDLVNENKNKWLLEGKKEGKIEGKLEGKIEGQAEILIKLLTKKFVKIPDNYKKKIMNLSQEKIDDITLEIFDMKKIEDIEKLL